MWNLRKRAARTARVIRLVGVLLAATALSGCLFPFFVPANGSRHDNRGDRHDDRGERQDSHQEGHRH